MCPEMAGESNLGMEVPPTHRKDVGAGGGGGEGGRVGRGVSMQ